MATLPHHIQEVAARASRFALLHHELARRNKRWFLPSLREPTDRELYHTGVATLYSRLAIHALDGSCANCDKIESELSRVTGQMAWLGLAPPPGRIAVHLAKLGLGLGYFEE